MTAIMTYFHIFSPLVNILHYSGIGMSRVYCHICAHSSQLQALHIHQCLQVYVEMKMQ